MKNFPRSERTIIGYLALTNILFAAGIDPILPAFDAIGEHFALDGSGPSTSLIVTAYFVGVGVGQLMVGPIADRFGRRSTLLGCVGVTALATIGTLLSPSFAVMLGFRFLWGVAVAGPAVMVFTIARDLYIGDEMARIISGVIGLFLVGPVVMPLISQVLVDAFGWQAAFLLAITLAGIVGTWTWSFGETLPVEQRRPIDVQAWSRASRLVLTNRTSGGYIAALVFSYGAFLVFLSSSQPIMANVYERPEWFAVAFSVISLANALIVWQSGRLVNRFGASTVAIGAAIVVLSTYSAMAVAAFSFGGVPPIALFGLMITVVTAGSTVFNNNAITLALQPMERIAGTASAWRGSLTLGVGTILAAFVDAQIDDTVTPLAIGGVIYCSLSLAWLMWARGGSLAIVDPDR